MYYLCSINKGADKLHDYHEADLHLYFSKKQIFYDKAQLNVSNFNNIFIEDLDKITKFTYKLYFIAFMNVYALD